MLAATPQCRNPAQRAEGAAYVSAPMSVSVFALLCTVRSLLLFSVDECFMYNSPLLWHHGSFQNHQRATMKQRVQSVDETVDLSSALFVPRKPMRGKGEDMIAKECDHFVQRDEPGDCGWIDQGDDCGGSSVRL